MFKVLLSLLCVLFLTSLAFAVTGTVPNDPAALANQILNAVQHKQWQLFAVLVVVAAVATLRWLTPKLHDKVGAFLNSNRGGSLLVLVSGAAGAWATAIIAGKSMSVSLLIDGLMVGVTASGGWNVVWDILKPNDIKPVAPSLPITKVG